jgi:alkylation response protein AidB-like acyl-CoA dehydrogenase
MLTNPITRDDDVEIQQIVRDFVSSTFPFDKVRAASATPAAYDEVAWKQMAGLGWSGISLPEAVGGADLGATVQCVLHRELGGRLAPTPFLASTAFAATALGMLGDPDAVAETLCAIADGTSIAALVLTPPSVWLTSDSPGIVASPDGPEWCLDGSADLVVGAGYATTLVVVAHTGLDEWGTFLVDPVEDGLQVSPQPTVDATRAFASVRLSGVRARLVSGALDAEALARTADRLAVFVGAELIGTATTALQTTLDYLRTRHQFGQPIGTFQALKHRVADLAVSLTTAQELVFMAARLIEADAHHELSLAAPLALARAGDAARSVTEEGIQLHGAIGFTEELEMGMFYKRVLCDLEIVATPAEARARIARLRCAP